MALITQESIEQEVTKTLNHFQTAIAGKAAKSHKHTTADVTGLDAALGGKAAASHKHVAADITDLQTKLNSKANSAHKHNTADINDLQQFVENSVNKVAPGIVPPGTMIFYAGGTVPSGWLLCNGAAVSRTEYAALFAAIGTKHGAGNNSTTFNLPNMHRRFAEGTTTASEVGQRIEAGLPDITGSAQLHGVEHVRNGKGAIASNGLYSEYYSSHGDSKRSSDTIGFNASLSNGIYGKSTTVQTPSIRLLPLIKI